MRRTPRFAAGISGSPSRYVALGVGLAVALGGRPCAAQDAVTGVAIEAYPNFETVGVVVTVNGDDDGDASAALAYHVGMGPSMPGHPLVRVSATTFSGAVFWLPAGTDMGVEVALEDPDGVTGGALSTSATTRAFVAPSATGTWIHVSPDGSPGAAGTEADPFDTITEAAAAAGPGDEVVVHAGTYHETVEMYSGGTEGAPVVIRAAGDGEAVLDGADPALRDPLGWTDEGGGVWSAAAAETRYVAVDGVRLWNYLDAGSLAAAPAGGGGFYWEAGSVHVLIPGGGTPATRSMAVSSLGRAFWLEGAPNVVIRDLVIRCYGAEEYSEGIMVRDGSHGVWIVDTTFENVMPGIWVKGQVDDLTVTGCTFSDVGLADFDWYEVKARGGMESGAIAIDDEYDGRGIVFVDNTVRDSFDGMRMCGNTDLDHPIHADVIRNSFRHLGDDGIETDGVCPDVRIVGNRWEDMLVGVSAAPAVVGPLWVIRNLMVFHRNVAAGSDWMSRPLKFNVGDDRPSGEIFVYHNTGWAGEDGQMAFTVTDDSRWARLVDVNNVWVGTDMGYYYVNEGDEPIEVDYDVVFSTTGADLFYWQGTHHADVAAFEAATGMMANGISADPLLEGAAGGDFTPAEASPAVDSALPIPGINDGWMGDGPDRGAIERGGALPPDPVPETSPDTVEPPPDATTDPGIDPATDTAGDPGDDTAGDGGGGGGCGCSMVA